MILVDSNVFVIALRYPRDELAVENALFLDALKTRGDGATCALNLLEVCGILSFNLSDQDLLDLFHHFPARFGVKVVPDGHDSRALALSTSREALAALRRRMSLGEALLVLAIERDAPSAAALVSWNARHFKNRLPMAVLTPSEWLRAQEERPS